MSSDRNADAGAPAAGRGARRTSPRIGERSARDAGVSLVESSMALMLLALIVAWVASSIGSTGRAIADAHSQEQATQLALEGVEWARSVTWSELRLDPSTVPGDPNVHSLDRALVGANFDLASDEPLVEGGEDALIPPFYQETLDTTTFTVRSYVTDAGTGLRRVVVEVTWEVASSRRRYFASTMISELSAG